MKLSYDKNANRPVIIVAVIPSEYSSVYILPAPGIIAESIEAKTGDLLDKFNFR